MKHLAHLVLLSLLTGACSWMNDGEGLFLNPEDDYLEVQEQPELEVPEDLRSLADTDPFPIPATPQAVNPRYYPKRPPLPDAIYANDNRNEVRIQRIGDRRWLVIPESPTTAWPKIKQFLADNGVPVVYEMPDDGRLNTEWLRIEASSYRDVIRTLLSEVRTNNNVADGMDRFLIRVEQGLQQQTTEVHVRHENNALRLAAPDAVAEFDGVSSALPDAEAEFLSEVGAYIAAKVSEQTISRVAQQIGSTRKAELARDAAGQPLLRLYLDRERAWATLGQALENAEVEVKELDRSAGKFDITVPQEVLTGDAKRGFFCRITFTCGRGDGYELELRLKNVADKVFEVTVLDEQAQSVDPDFAQQILVLIREFAT